MASFYWDVCSITPTSSSKSHVCWPPPLALWNSFSAAQQRLSAGLLSSLRYWINSIPNSYVVWFCFFPQLTPVFTGIWKRSLFFSAKVIWGRIWNCSGVFKFYSHALTSFKKEKTITMEIPTRDKDRECRRRWIVLLLWFWNVLSPSFSVNIKLLFNCTFWNVGFLSNKISH